MLSFIAILFIVIGAMGLLVLGSVSGLIQLLLFIFSVVALIHFMEVAKH